MLQRVIVILGMTVHIPKVELIILILVQIIIIQYIFDGIDDYTNLGNIDFINSGQQNEYTISCWLKVDDLSF